MGTLTRCLLPALLLCGCGQEPIRKDTAGVDTEDRVVAGPSQSPDQQAAAAICINELMPVNDHALVLDDGATPDWVELHNPAELTVALDGWQLHNETDGGSASLDGLSIEAGGYLLLFADEGAQNEPEHLPFKLVSDGGALWLESPDGGGERLTFGWADDDHAIAKATDCCTEADCLEHRYRGTPGDTNTGG